MKHSLCFRSIIILLSVLLVCCSEDYNQQVDIVDNIPKPSEKVFGAFNGLVLNVQNEPVISAHVTIGDEYAETDQNGFFKIEGFFNVSGVRFKVISDNYFDVNGFLIPQQDGIVQVRINLVEKNVPISSSSDKSILIEEESYSIEFQENSFVDMSGNAYTGELDIYVSYLDPTVESFSSKIKGGLHTKNDDDEMMILPFGVLNVEIVSSTGLSLNIGQEATIKFRVPQDLLSVTSAQLPLWSLNELSGYWENEGELDLIGTEYIGTVDHFSSWACGESLTFAKLEGQVIRNGQPYPHANVGVSHFQWWRIEAQVDETGRYSTFVFLDRDFDLTVVDRCNKVLYSEQVRLQEQNVVKDIIFQETESSLNINGNVTCGADPIGASYVLLDFQDNGYTGVVQTDGNGYFEYLVDDCGLENVILRAYDIVESTRSEPRVVEESGSYDLDVCAAPFSGEIIFEIDGEEEPYVIDNCIVTIGPSGMILPSDLYFFEATDSYENVQGVTDESAKYEISIFNRTDPPKAPFGPISNPDVTDGVPFYYIFAPAPYVLNLSEEGIVEVTIANPALFIRHENGENTDLSGTVRIRAIVQ